MSRALPPAGETYSYRLAGDGDTGRERVELADALLAFSDDLLETGGARLALERAFRWGYRQEHGDHVPGLLEQLQDLRFQRDRLQRQTEDPAFLDALGHELDRLDALDGKESDAGQTTLDRLAERFERGSSSAEAKAEFDDMVASLRQMPGQGADRDAAKSQRRQDSESLFRMGASSRQARLDRGQRMLSHGGVEVEDTAPGSWKVEDPNRLRSLSLDLEKLARIEGLDSAIQQLEAIGSVAELPAIDLERLALDLPEEIGSWLRDWSSAASAFRQHRSRDTAAVRPSLPPAVISAIGRDLLKGLFRGVAAPLAGEHRTNERGTAGDAAETVAPWEPGRPMDLNLPGTLTNAIRRGGMVGTGRVRLRPDDFEVVERTARTAVSTVLVIDRSRSMGQSGAWAAAKKVTLAMHELIRQSYPRDSLSVAAFSSKADAVSIDQLPEMQWDRYEHGTHLQAALSLGRRMLRGSPAATRQVVAITDGEPTIATVSGEEIFASPPTDEVLEATMREVIRCTRERIVINMVVLGAEPGVANFAEQVARVNGGRIFHATGQDLGAFILRDYVTR